jgi:transcriptional regulator with XRE-family HTH domain
MILIRRLLGDVLRRKRQDEGRTLRQLAAEARISPGYLSEIERGQKEPSSELLAAICEALQARLSDVLREVSIELAAAELAAQLESERIAAPVPTARVGAAASGAPVKSMPLAKPAVVRGAVRAGARPSARPVTRRVPPAAVGAVSGGQNLAVGQVPVPTPGLAMGAPNLLAYPVVLPGAGSNAMPQLAMR